MSDKELSAPKPQDQVQTEAQAPQNQVSRPAFPAAKPKRGKKVRRAIVIVLALVVLAVGFIWWRGKSAVPVMAQDDLTEFAVARGNVTHTVSGPGTVSPVNIFTVATNLTGDILEDYFEEGEEVEKDALLFQLDGETTSLNFDAARDTLANAQDSYQSALRSKQDLHTYTGQAGLISALYVKKGDSVNSGGKIADITDTGSLLVTLPFNSGDAAEIRAGDSAEVFIDDNDLMLGGHVQKVMSGQSVSATGALVTNVEIVFANPGALSPGGFATAVVSDYACNDAGQVEYAAHDTIYAAGSGKISELTVSAGDRVSAGQRILTLENNNVDDTLSRAGRTVADAEKKLTNTQNNLQIKSPIAGTVLAKSAKAGDTLYNASSTLAVVADMSRLIFTIEVDELEIRYVEAGQQATVTADAYEGEIFAGLVTNVGKTGTSSNGVTTYPVTIEIAEYGGLLPGMNVNADIVVREALDVLYIPVDAVTRGQLVLVKDEGSGSIQDDEGQPPMMMMYGDGQSGDGQPPMTRDDGQGGEDRPPMTRGEGQGGEGRPPVMSGDGQGGEGRPPMMRGEGQGGEGQPQIFIQDGSPANLGFMGAQAPEGYVYRRVETGISDSNFVEIISGLNEGDIIAYRPSVQDSGNMMNFMFMGPPRGGGAMYSTTVQQEVTVMPGGR